jgi:hypothetical protein
LVIGVSSVKIGGVIDRARVSDTDRDMRAIDVGELETGNDPGREWVGSPTGADGPGGVVAEELARRRARRRNEALDRGREARQHRVQGIDVDVDRDVRGLDARSGDDDAVGALHDVGDIISDRVGAQGDGVRTNRRD